MSALNELNLFKSNTSNDSLLANSFHNLDNRDLKQINFYPHTSK